MTKNEIGNISILNKGAINSLRYQSTNCLLKSSPKSFRSKANFVLFHKIIHSDWLTHGTWLVTTNQNTLFRSNIINLLWLFNIILSSVDSINKAICKELIQASVSKRIELLSRYLKTLTRKGIKSTVKIRLSFTYVITISKKLRFD